MSGGRRPTRRRTWSSTARTTGSAASCTRTRRGRPSWAQAEREIPLLGTTHADLSGRPIPLTRALTEAEVDEDYEGATGRALVEATTEHDSCALVRGHGPFAWGASPAAAVEAAVTLEQVARMALLTTLLAPDGPALADAVRRKHFERKHGPNAYYGQ